MNSLPLSHVVISQLTRFYWENCCLQILQNTVALNSYLGLSALRQKNFLVCIKFDKGEGEEHERALDDVFGIPFYKPVLNSPKVSSAVIEWLLLENFVKAPCTSVENVSEATFSLSPGPAGYVALVTTNVSTSCCTEPTRNKSSCFGSMQPHAQALSFWQRRESPGSVGLLLCSVVLVSSSYNLF